jgi:hypothetical protein
LVREVGKQQTALLGFASVEEAAEASLEPKDPRDQKAPTGALPAVALGRPLAPDAPIYAWYYGKDKPVGMIVVVRMGNRRWTWTRFLPDRSATLAAQARATLAKQGNPAVGILHVAPRGSYLFKVADGRYFPVGTDILKEERLFEEDELIKQLKEIMRKPRMR